MRFLVLIVALVLSALTVSAQSVEVSVATDPKKVKEILAKERQKSEENSAFFAEDERCRGFLRASEWTKAEASCRKAILLVEKLPKEHTLSKSSARKYLAVALLWQQNFGEAIELLEKSLEIGRPVIDDSDAETGDIYFLMGQAYHLSKNVSAARSYYEKAEKTYRTAFAEIGDDYFRFPYARKIKNIVEAHHHVLKSAGLADEAEKMRIHLAEMEREFARYLVEK